MTVFLVHLVIYQYYMNKKGKIIIITLNNRMLLY